MLQLARHLLLIVLAAAGAGAAFAQQQPVKQVYLIQNSGWMEPFYTDATSTFLQEVVDTIASTAGASPIVIAAFNQDGQVEGRQSPDVLYSGAYSNTALSDTMRSLALARKPSGAYADTDFAGAVRGAITRPDILNTQQGVIWIFTNNKNSPDNSQEVAKLTKAFWDALRSNAAVSRIVAFPIPGAFKGPTYDTTGFIIYGIAYGDQAAEVLKAQVADGAPLIGRLPSRPALLKPLDSQAVAIDFDSAPVNGISVYRQGEVLIFSGLSAEQPSPVTLRARIRNLHYPLTIEDASLSTRWLYAGASSEPAPAIQAQISPSNIKGLGALQASGPLDITVTFPPLSGDLLVESRNLDGYMEIELSGLRYGLDPEFLANASKVFGGADLTAPAEDLARSGAVPAIFSDYQNVTGSVTRVPIRMTVEFSAMPLMILAVSVLGGIAALCVAGWWLFAPRRHLVTLDGERMPVRVSSFGSKPVFDRIGREWKVKGSLFGASAEMVKPKS